MEGRIALDHPTIIAVIDGGCGSIEVTSDCRHRYSGADFEGAASYIPAGVTRHIKMSDVQSKWASLSIRPDLFTLSGERGRPSRSGWPRSPIGRSLSSQPCSPSCAVFAARESVLILSIAKRWLFPPHNICLLRRYGQRAETPSTIAALPGWRLRRAKDYVAARLGDRDLRLDDVAASLGLSTGFFHRSFRQTTGETPLGYIQRRRVEEAMRLLASKDMTIAEIAIRVGFCSPSHFTRLFHRHSGITPSQYRNGKR